jgi:hypothetical protein
VFRRQNFAHYAYFKNGFRNFCEDQKWFFASVRDLIISTCIGSSCRALHNSSWHRWVKQHKTWKQYKGGLDCELPLIKPSPTHRAKTRASRRRVNSFNIFLKHRANSSVEFKL